MSLQDPRGKIGTKVNTSIVEKSPDARRRHFGRLKVSRWFKPRHNHLQWNGFQNIQKIETIDEEYVDYRCTGLWYSQVLGRRCI